MRADEGERKIGQRVYDEINKQGKIVTGGGYNRVLAPIAARLGQAAKPLYDEPFQFYVIHDKTINAFAVPGGFMFVNDGLIDAVGTKDELAGVMCHEMNHVIHHDGVHLQSRANTMNIGLTVASILLGSPMGRIATDAAGYAANFALLHYSRNVETSADLGGADLCAKAGFNPYGLVWTMELLQSQAGGHGTLEMLSNHPRDDHRISDLLAHFRSQPDVFARFADDRAHAVPVYAQREDPSPLPFAHEDCPKGDPGTLSAPEAQGWFAGLTPGLTPPAGTDGAFSSKPDGDAIVLPTNSAVRWFRPKQELGGTAIAFDPQTHAVFVCDASPVATRVAVVGAFPEPPFPTPHSALAEAHTGLGIALLAPVSDVLRLYGNARPVPAANGSQLYRYARQGPSGAGVAEWFRVKDGAVIAFGRDLVYEDARTQAVPATRP